MTGSISIPKPKAFLICNVISLLIGVTVLIGWYTHQPSLIQIHESWVPMQYNTALGFFFCGLAGILILYSKYSIRRFIVLIPILLGGLTLIEYVFDMDLLIDEMFMKHFITTKTLHPGRMAPNTALCFLLTGISLGLTKVSSMSRSRKLVLVSMTGGLLVTTLAVTALIGYLIDLEGVSGWGNLTRMAIHTSIGFIFLGVGLVANATEKNNVEKSVLVFSVIILVAISLVLSVLAIMKQRTQKEVANTLQISLNRTLSELSLWADEVERDALDWSQLQGVKKNIQELLKVPKNTKSLLASVPAKKIDDILSPIIKRHDYEGYIVIAPDYTNIASMLKLNVGDKNLLVGVEDYLHRAFSGETIITPPQKTDIPLEDFSGRISDDVPTMFSLVPVFGENEEIIAVLSFRLNPFKSFTPIFELGTLGETGEAYAFNKDGLMVSNSRFNKLLAQLNIIPPDATSALNLQIRDPGGNLTEGFSSPVSRENQPFTEMAMSALRGERNMNVKGYRDYRGVPVVGCWAWINKLGIGVVAEMDLEEMYADYNFFRKLILSLLLSMVVLFAVFTLQIYKRRRLLIESEERLNLALSASNAGVWDWNVATGEIVFSPHWYESLGYKNNEFAGIIDNWKKLVHPEDMPKVTETLNNYFEGKTSFYEVKNRLLMKSGEYRWNIDRGKIIERDAQGNPLRMVGVDTDITSLKKVEVELEKSKNILQVVLDTIPVAVYWKDKDSRYLGSNIHAAKNAGLNSPEEIIGRDDYSLAWREQADLYRKDDLKVIQSGIPKFNYEEPLDTGDGRFLWVRTNKIPLRDTEGNITGILGIHEDITERRKVAKELEKHQNHLEELIVERTKELKRNEGQLRLVTNNLPVLISYVDSELYYRYNNSTYEKWFERPLSEITGKRVQEVLGELAYQCLEGYFKTVLAGQEVSHEKKIPFKYGGERSISAHYFPDFDKHGKVVGFFALIQDVSERKQMEEKLAKSQMQVIHADKLSSLGKLIASISHEINNPIFGIRNVLWLISKDINTNERNLDLIVKAIRECDRVSDIIKNLYDFYSPPKVDEEKEIINISEIIKDTIWLINKELEINNIVLEKHFSENLVAIEGIRDQIKQVVLNLLQNAVEAIGNAGGKIIIQTKVIDSNVIIKVQDTGCGILSEHLGSIFEPFNSTKSAVKGTGLGLSISYGIIKAHNGSIMVNSKYGTGSEFVITFPAVGA